jgi:hypothetical protein
MPTTLTYYFYFKVVFSDFTSLYMHVHESDGFSDYLAINKMFNKIICLFNRYNNFCFASVQLRLSFNT